MEMVLSKSKTIPMHTNDVYALYVCMRQISLSVHRCRWTSWKELVAFYHNKKAPQTLLNAFSFKIGKESGFVMYENPKSGVGLLRLEYLAKRCLGIKRSSLSMQELETACFLLNNFILFLDTDNPDPTNVSHFMSDLQTYTGKVLEPKLSLKEINAPVEHYLANENHSTKTFEALTGYKLGV